MSCEWGHVWLWLLLLVTAGLVMAGLATACRIPVLPLLQPRAGHAGGRGPGCPASGGA